MTDSRDRRPWEAPDCPNGHDHLFVDGTRQEEDWQCFKCRERFDVGRYHDGMTNPA